jgi:hypothetical protein
MPEHKNLPSDFDPEQDGYPEERDDECTRNLPLFLLLLGCACIVVALLGITFLVFTASIIATFLSWNFWAAMIIEMAIILTLAYLAKKLWLTDVIISSSQPRG